MFARGNEGFDDLEDRLGQAELGSRVIRQELLRFASKGVLVEMNDHLSNIEDILLVLCEELRSYAREQTAPPSPGGK